MIKKNEEELETSLEKKKYVEIRNIQRVPLKIRTERKDIKLQKMR